jgi:integrative and conjugative element protein (TIGR02256 family)
MVPIQLLGTGAPGTSGQLFARISGQNIVLELTTRPRETIRCSRHPNQPDRSVGREEIDRLHHENSLFLRDWHTRPEPFPHPFPQDLASIRGSVTKSTHDPKGFLLIIVGTDAVPASLWVGLHGTAEALRLTPQCQLHSDPTTNTEASS